MLTQPLLPTHATAIKSVSSCQFDFRPGDQHVQLERLQGRGVWHRDWFVEWCQLKLIGPFVAILKRGLEPKCLSLSAALGLTFGMVPIWGLSLFMCMLAAAILQSKCHLPTLMLANFVVSPLELGLVVPFMRLGELVTQDDHFPISKDEFWKAIQAHEAMKLICGILHAVIGWAIFAPFSVAVLYIGFLPMFRFFAVRFGTRNLF